MTQGVNPPARRSPRRVARAVLRAACLVGAVLLAAAGGAGQPGAQSLSGQAQREMQDRAAGDPSQDIIIQGVGFSKLMLAVEGAEGVPTHVSEHHRRLAPLVEKNLCWSGLFNLRGGRTDHCRPVRASNRVDMRLALTVEEEALMLRLHDAGPEQALLFQEGIPLTEDSGENRVIAVINRLAERITGEPGLLGSTIAFSLRQPGYAKVIVATTTHGEQIRLISQSEQINILPRFAPDGRGIVYTMLGPRGSRVYYQNLMPKKPGVLESRFLTDAGSLNTGGGFSPDGEEVVITMSVSGNADLFRINLEEGTREQLTNRRGIETQASWSPDGTRLVMVSDRSGTPQIYLYDLTTGEDLRLTFDGAYNADPKWSPDGESILFTKRVEGVDHIFIMDEYGENVRAVTRGRFDAEQAEWSPDGRQVVFASNRTGDYKLYMVSADGSSLRRLTNTPEGFNENSPTWTVRRLVR